MGVGWGVGDITVDIIYSKPNQVLVGTQVYSTLRAFNIR